MLFINILFLIHRAPFPLLGPKHNLTGLILNPLALISERMKGTKSQHTKKTLTSIKAFN